MISNREIITHVMAIFTWTIYGGFHRWGYQKKPRRFFSCRNFGICALWIHGQPIEDNRGFIMGRFPPLQWHKLG